MASILDDIFAAKRVEVRACRERTPLAAIVEAAKKAPPPRRFVDALRARRSAIIAEVKRASPSKGDIFPGLDPATVARDYAAAGAAAISVLTDRHFKGSLDDLRAVRGATDLPILRKDFIFDEYQIYQARAAGADCILLIAATLKADELRALAEIARRLELAALVEAHNAEEFALAESSGAELIGINNRDLHTFKTDIATTEELLRGYRGHALIVSESGIETPEHIRRLDHAGARAFLIGESLLRGGNPRAAISALADSLAQSRERDAR
ncbi:MAG TPA: indole-3-glycerol phosphate synthase TrpC [Candidatus Binataceae bacterium]|nr:indole-3-glycerol phosphate synthase TrpC [Candidatus Binataceae bacterium]